jgi:hypothetical protein
MNKNIIATAFILYGTVQGIYSALVKDDISQPIGIYVGIGFMVLGGMIAEDRTKKKEGKLAKEIVND